MQMHLPSPQQIYDLSTQQLSKLQVQIQHTIGAKRKSALGNAKITDEIQSLSQLLENISLEIEERKTIEFFTELCISDGTANKYVKEITDFNNQFKKLANEMLNNKSQGHGMQSRAYDKEKSQNMNNTDKIYRNPDTDQGYDNQDKQNSNRARKPSQTSITTNSFSKQNHTIGTQSSDFATSATSQMNKKAATTITKKMGVGHTNMKKNKNSMQQFIKATLAKSKAVDYVSTKGGSTLKKSPDNKINNNGSHVSHHDVTATPLSTTKSIKPPSQGSDTGSSNRKQAPSSNKTIPASQKSINQKNDRQSLIKKRNDAIEKMKSMKKPQSQGSSQNLPPQPKKKGAKGLDAKSLVQMVKQQEDAKKKRQQEPLEDRRKPKQEKKAEEKSQQLSGEEKQQKLTQIQGDNFSNKTSTKSESLQYQKPTQKPITTRQNASSSKLSQKQNEFPIKQEINAISSSDTESDSDSVKLSANKKMSSKKESIMKDEKYCPIPEQEIEESIVFVKEQAQTKQKSVIVNESAFKKQLQSLVKQQTKGSNSTQAQDSKNSEGFKSQQIKKPTVQVSSQNFGRITEEYYNPNGYDDAKSDEQEDNPRKNVDMNKEQPKQDSQNQNQPEVQQITTQQSQSNKRQVPKLSTTKTKAQKQQKKGSSKNLKLKKQQKKTVLDQQIVSPSLTDFQSNKMYNQEYWLHIKQEAQTKIQRFKQEKQIERKQRELKAKLIEEESKRIKAELQMQKGVKKPISSSGKQNQSTAQNNLQSQLSQQPNTNRNIQTPVTLQDDDNDKFIERQKNNLKKIQAQNNANGSSKKASKKPQPAALVKQPKPSYPKPQFNYLQIYPTFNHIFNVFYTKTQSQALLDIPLVMKQMIEMFETHLQYQRSRKNNFRPAIFMPFDNRNSKMNQFTDARLLLQHAETTYVNLKTLIQRVEIFNCNIQGQFENCTEQQRQNTQFYRVVKTKQEVYDIITTSFLRRKGWKQLPHGQNLKANWNLFWSWSKPQIDMNKLIVFQRINHYPFNKNLSRKDLLYKNIDSFRKTHKVPFPYLPVTYNLPKEFTQFSKRFHQEELVNREKNYWIMKPIGKSRGRGIKLINSLGDLNYLDNIVVQKYISNPLLIDGYKFDMRIYVLVTSFHPLEAFVYREGFARFSTQKYSLQPMDMKNNFVHLTNFAINRHNQQAKEQFTEGSKISLKSLKQKVTKMGYSFASVWSQIHQIIIKSLLACSVSVPPFPAAFELFGYDIMLDDTGQCSLIEINASPSLQRSYMIDDIIKQSLIDDIIEIVNPPAFSKEQAINVMNERLSPEFRNYKKGQKGANIDEEDLIHLARILKYQKMRRYGQMPEKIGLFEMVAPSPMSKDLEKLIKSKSGINAPHNID